MPVHCHADPYLCLVLSGRYEDSIAGRGRTFAPADAMFGPPGFEHRDRVGSGGARFFMVAFDPAAGESFTDRREVWMTPHRWNASGPSLELARLHVDFSRSGGRLDAMEIESRLLALWSGITGARATEHRGAAWLDGARARLHDEFAQSLRIVTLAADAGVHPPYFTRAFRARYGVGPAEYRARLRVTAACRSLADRRPIRQIAITLGYADTAHFTRDFLARVGITPAAYRRVVSGC
jgi:AraC family transcriptional regulator